MRPESLLERPLPTRKCTVGCPVLDRCLAGGVPCNSITELVSESGCGKTQLSLQLLLSAQLPASLGGLSASSLYIHSEFPFPFRRLRQLSRSFCNAHPDLFPPRGGVADPCDRIFVQGVHSADHLLDVLSKTDSFLAQPSWTPQLPIKVIVIDSIAALFRSEFENNPSYLWQRSSLFFKISSTLKALAKRFELAVLITNQVVDVMDSSEGLNGLKVGNLGSLYSSGRRVCPALGLSWANCVNSRLFLSRNEEIAEKESGAVEGREARRWLHVLFAPHLPKSSCEFVVKRDGVFGVER